MQKESGMEQAMKDGLQHQEFCLYYQPKQDAVTGKILGVEALVRWNRPNLGLVSPADFIPIAEETGLIIPMGEWILRTACQQAKEWQNKGFPPMVMAVNLSARQLYQPNLIDMVDNILKEAKIAPHYIELEITESMMMDVDHVLPVVLDLKKLGVRISLDDFGKGYSSLYLVKEFPIDTLKIDQSFIRNCTIDMKDATIVKTIISMAHELDIEVVAEGIETKEQLIFLQENVCNQCQGFLFSRPLPPEELEAKYTEIEQIVTREGIPPQVSREKWLEEELRKTRQELIETLRQQQGMIFKFTKRNGKFIHTMSNGELLYRMGITPERIIGKELHGFLHPLVAEDKHTYYERAWNGEDKVIYEGKVGDIYYLCSLRTVKRGGKVVEVIGSAVDITERIRVEKELKESERQHRLMVEWSPEAILVHRDGLILYANEACVQLLGASSEEDLIGRDILDFSTSEYLELVKTRINNLDGEGIVVPTTEEKVIRIDGKELDVEVTGISLRYNGIPSYFMLIHDLSKRRIRTSVDRE
jgi:PAS domain S-box-containing protein